jgi:hypothetical protein
LNDDTLSKEQLHERQMRLELDEVSEEEYAEREAESSARLGVIRERQLGLLQQVHTADSSPTVIESGGDDEGGFWEPGERE